MSIITLHFWIFAAVVTLLYFVVPKKWQWTVILCGNVYFYFFAGLGCLALMLASSLVAFLCALRLDNASVVSKALPAIENGEIRTEAKKSLLSVKKFICAVAVIVVGGTWAVLKYSDFFISNINIILSKINEAWTLPVKSWILPLGISFYTFHIIGYVVDVYRDKYPAERNFAKFFAFVSFFPHMIQGPFTRFNDLGKSILEPHRFSYDRLSEGCARILWGLVKKLIVADRLSVTVQLVFGNFRDYAGFHILFAMILYCIELYADFSGYMDIVCGLSHIWGIRLPENFRQPYFARSVEEFWRRWHITLGQWFKDYVFFPVSMSRLGQKLGRKARKKWGPRAGKLVPGYFALIFVWTATGLWHGANWTFLVWGYLNLFVIILSMQLGDFYKRAKEKLHIRDTGWAWQLFSIVRTFLLVCFFRFFSAEPNIGTALSTLKHIVTNLSFRGMRNLETLFAGIGTAQLLVVLAGILAMLVVDILRERNVWDKVRLKCPIVIRSLLYAALILLLVLLVGGSSDLTGGFMYANF